MEEIDELIIEFKHDIFQTQVSALEIVRKYITFGMPYVFKDDQNKYFKLKNVVANKFGINPQDVIMVGSAKLGFSIAPYKIWKKFDDESDIDIVIISEDIFKYFWKELLEFNINRPRSQMEQNNYEKFLTYFFKGWLRPDLFSFDYSGREEWFKFFQSISYRDYDRRKITGAIYFNNHFFEYYHTLNIQNIRGGGFLNAR